MNDTTQQQKKDSILKSLAIFGFIGIIIAIAWLSVKLVDLAPNAFSSLASLAETIQQERVATSTDETGTNATLPLTSNTTLINTGEEVVASWGVAKLPGSYTFSYECSEGIAIDLIGVPELGSIACATSYRLGDVNEVRFSVDSEKKRYADVRYAVSFFGINDVTPRASGSAQVTVINSAISNLATSSVATEGGTTETTPTTTPVEMVEEDPTPVTPEPTVTTPIPSPVAPREEYTYVIPTSDPAGRTDLGVRFLGTGTIVNNTFVPGVLKQDKAGAIQFEVKNYGSKTSTGWTYTVTLPNGTTHRSTTQVALKPNERAVLTIGFAAPERSEHRFVVIVSEPTDQVTLNDSFQQMVSFAK